MTLDLLAALGSDRYLTLGETAARRERAGAAVAWDVYRSEFGGFTGCRVDSRFARLDHPASSLGVLRVREGTTVVVAGTGPSLAATAPLLAARRDHVSIWTSPRGAEALVGMRIRPDAVIVQHQTDLDAYLSTRHLADRGGDNVLDHMPVVIAEPRTPHQLLANVPRARLAALDPAIGWGHWPASLASLALQSGAAAVALAGVDLGTVDTPDPAHAALRALLAEISRASRVPTIDLGDGARKDGWPVRPLDDVLDTAGAKAVALARTSWASPSARKAELASMLASLADHVAVAAAFHDLAREAQRAGGPAYLEGRLVAAWDILMGWRKDMGVRLWIQEGLGARLLPVLWRSPDEALAGPAWRPVLLATEEIVRQAAAAHQALADRAEARTA